MNNVTISQLYLKTIFNYNAENGEFTRKTGSKSGTLDNTGYSRIMIDGKRYLVHRLIWMFNYGVFPNNIIDHINRDKSDNRLSNLREATQSQNVRNSNRSNGVYFRKDSCKWRANITIEGERIYLGSFNNYWDALCKRKSFEYLHF